MYIHLDACVSVGVRMCQHPFLMFLFVCFLTERPWETYFSILESWPSLFSIPWRYSAFVIQVAGIVTSGATVWEDGGHVYHIR